MDWLDSFLLDVPFGDLAILTLHPITVFEECIVCLLAFADIISL